MSSLKFQFPKKPYRTLSFDGGGIRGILAATLLHRVSQECPEIIENTDLFVGTSAGSFIALGLASGMSPNQVARLFSKENGKKIFGKSRLFYLFRPKYSNRPLKDVLKQIFPNHLQLRNLPKHVVVASFKIDCPQSNNWEPVFFNNFSESNNAEETVVHAALASSAAPIYFPSYNKRIDGGVIANNPDTAAISFAVGEHGAKQKLEDIVHLSFGTGWNPMKITRDTTNWGIAQWAYTPYSGRCNPKLPLLNILTDGDVEADMFVSQQLLDGRYFRLSPRLPEKVNLDDYKKIPQLIELANSVDLSQACEFVQTYWGNPIVKKNA